MKTLTIYFNNGNEVGFEYTNFTIDLHSNTIVFTGRRKSVDNYDTYMYSLERIDRIEM